MPTQEQANKDLVRSAVAAWNDRDRETFAALVAEDAVHRTPWGTTRGEAYVDEEMATVEEFPDHTYSIEEIVAEDDLVAVKYAVTTAPPPEYRGFETTGDSIELATMELFRIEDDQIVESFALVDRLSLYEQAGILNDWRIRNQYLSVLTRVLRHNLRNDLGSIIGYAEAILADDTDAATHARSIRSVADELVGLAEKARTLEQRALEQPLAPREVELAGRVRAWVEELRQTHPAASIAIDTGDDADQSRLRTDPRLVEAVLGELVENAVLHSDVDEPQVVITIDGGVSTGSHVVLRVCDNGPGIPSHELEPLQQESEDPLIHGSSVGLWAVKWSVDRLDGELTFDENDPRGSVVTVRLPSLEDTD